MSSNSRPPHAVVVLPPVRHGRIPDVGLRRWLSKGELVATSPRREMLSVVAETIGSSEKPTGFAALRFWGQTGDRSAAWMMAADPVFLEARLDHLCLHSLAGDTSRAELGTLFDDLQSAFGGEEFSFVRIGHFGYVRTDTALDVSPRSSTAIDGMPPDEFLPGSEELQRLLSEVQMFLHAHPVNEARECRGLPPINSLWFWGGGVASEARAEPLFTLFADDPLFRGFWLSREGVTEPWTGDFGAMSDSGACGFVAVPPEQADRDGSYLSSLLESLRDLLQSNRVGRLTFCSRDGVTAHLRRSHGLRVWRKTAPLLEPR